MKSEFPIEHIGWNHTTDKDDYAKVKKKIMAEKKKLNGEEIKQILFKNFENKGYLLRTERNYKAENINPFDFVIGEHETMTITGCEIKGDTDNFKRLGNQLNSYMFACDAVYLVLHKKEPPEWLPECVGVWRVSNKGKIYQEKHSYIRDEFDISSMYECKELMKANNLGKNEQLRETLSILKGARKNILFNRFFAVHAGYNAGFSKFYPFTELQRKVLMGFDVLENYKKIKRDVLDIEKRFKLLKEVVGISVADMGQLTLGDKHE